MGEDTKSGAGRYFTSRALIHAMIERVCPEPSKLIANSACGTGGFFLAAYNFMTNPDNFKLGQQAEGVLEIQGDLWQRDRRHFRVKAADILLEASL